MRKIILLLALPLFFGCVEPVKTGNSSKLEMEQTEANQQRLAAAIPPPQLETSLERINLVKRLERLNKENGVGYVYLMDGKGGIVGYFPVKGKVSSLNSYLTTPQQAVVIPTGTSGNYHYEVVTLESPDFDGTYGQNDDGIFFFTEPDDIYVEWHGNYFYSDHYIPLAVQPIFTVDATKQYAPSSQKSN